MNIQKIVITTLDIERNAIKSYEAVNIDIANLALNKIVAKGNTIYPIVELDFFTNERIEVVPIELENNIRSLFQNKIEVIIYSHLN